jgi:ribosome-associated protein
MIQIVEGISIPDEELRFTAARSSGPGGQKVNKTSTRVTLWFDVAHSPSLSEEQKRLIFERLPTRTNKDGLLWVVSQKTRSQKNNRDLALSRFTELLGEALKQDRPRKKIKISLSAKHRRVEEKRHLSRLKQGRFKKVWEDQDT